MLFHEMIHVLELFSENFMKTSKPDSFLEKLQLLAKSMIFHAFSRNEPLFPTFFRKVDQNLETRWFCREVEYFRKIDDFTSFLAI